MRFYAGRMFPEKYQGGIFIAEHGSWNRSTPIGYRVTFVNVENGRNELMVLQPVNGRIGVSCEAARIK